MRENPGNLFGKRSTPGVRLQKAREFSISDDLALLEQGKAEIAACDYDGDGTSVHGSKGVRLGPKGSGTGVLAACASGAVQSVTPSR